MEHDHFKGKSALNHLAEKQAMGYLSSKEVHGLEVPGHINGFADSARDTAIALLLILACLTAYEITPWERVQLLALFAIGWMIWKAGRSSWLGWSRLERLHRVLEQEKWEIEHNRPQEREELKELYGAKGFEGKLLEDVVDVLMADENRLLKVMIEEEMGLSLENVEHPLKQGVFSFLGAFGAALLVLIASYYFSWVGALLTGLMITLFTTYLTSIKADNRALPSMVWNGGLLILSFGITYFLTDFFFS